MKAMRWIGVVGIVAWTLGGGTGGAQDKPPSSEVKVESKSTGKAESKGPGKGGRRVNINQASKADLMKLDGVNAGTAQKIITYRDAHGPFKRPHDLSKVDGVGKEVLERNAGRISVK